MESNGPYELTNTQASEERCTHELLPGQCADCKGLTEPDPYEGLLIDRFLFDAKYPGRCAVNQRHQWLQGEPIALAVYDHPEGPPFEKLGWVCDDCAQRIAKPGTSVQ